MAEVKKELEKKGHTVFVPNDTQDCIENPELKNNFENDLESELEHCFENDVLGDAFNKIEESDVMIHLNYPKNGINGYVEPSGLMEVGVAFHLKKKIFLMQDVNKERKCALEIMLTRPVILDGDLSGIK